MKSFLLLIPRYLGFLLFLGMQIAKCNDIDLGGYITERPTDGLTKYRIRPPRDPSRMNFLIYAYGTRGDVQPMIHLAKIIMSDGHHCVVAAHKEDEDWIKKNGIQYIKFDANRTIIGSLFEEWTNGGISTIKGQIRLDKVLHYMDDTLVAAAKTMQYQNIHMIDAVIAPNWYLFGSQIAEYLRVPFIEAQFFPNTMTGDFDLYTAEENYKGLHKLFPWFSKQLSKFTYSSSDIGLTAIGLYQQNRFRKSLGLRPMSLSHWHRRLHAAPIIYAFSKLVIPKPKEWSDHVHEVGYWIAENSGQVDWTPPEDLARFLGVYSAPMSDAMRSINDKSLMGAHPFPLDTRPVVYVDLSSMMNYASAQKKLISSLEPIKDSKNRWIIATGPKDGPLNKFLQEKWALAKDTSTVFLKTSAIPHTWLLPRVNVFVHHGGAGTSAAGYFGAVPTIVIPQLADQVQNCAFAERLGVGLCMSIKDKKVNLEEHVKYIVDHPEMKQKVIALSDGLHKEDSRRETLSAIYTELDYILSTGNQFPGQYIKKKDRE